MLTQPYIVHKDVLCMQIVSLLFMGLLLRRQTHLLDSL
jgi:hypothetical protein